MFFFYVNIENLNQQSIEKEKFELEGCRSLCESCNFSLLWKYFGFCEIFIVLASLNFLGLRLGFILFCNKLKTGLLHSTFLVSNQLSSNEN